MLYILYIASQFAIDQLLGKYSKTAILQQGLQNFNFKDASLHHSMFRK